MKQTLALVGEAYAVERMKMEALVGENDLVALEHTVLPCYDKTPEVRVPLVGGSQLVDATFVARPNQFVIVAELASGQQVQAHCADRGRLRWLVPGTPLLLGAKPAAGRKTAFQAAAAWTNAAWASLDTHLPNRLIEQALHARALAQFEDYTVIKREAQVGNSRFDFRLAHEAQCCYLEVKSVGTVANGIARFPDAPTMRGRRHLAELAELASRGTRTALLFVAQHAAATGVLPDRTIDPAFADALRDAVAAGVEVYAYRCPVSRGRIGLGPAIPCVYQ